MDPNTAFILGVILVVVGIAGIATVIIHYNRQRRREEEDAPSLTGPEPTAEPAGPAVGGPVPSPAIMARMPLSQLVQVLGLGNAIKVDNKIGMTPGRIILAIAWLVVTAFILVPTGARLVSFVSDNTTAWFWGGMALWAIAIGFTVQFFVVYVREDTAFIGIETLTGTQHVYTTRLNIKYPTETVHKRNFINLELAEISETVTYNTKDGARYTYRYLILYRPSVKRLPIYRAVKEEDIENEIKAVVRSALSLQTQKRTADELGTEEASRQLEEAIRNALGQYSDAGHELEYRFGIDLVNVSLSEATPDKDIVQANQAKILAKKFNEAMTTIKQDHPDLSSQEAGNFAAMFNKEKVSKEVKAYELGNLPVIVERAFSSAAATIAAALRRE